MRRGICVCSFTALKAGKGRMSQLSRLWATSSKDASTILLSKGAQPSTRGLHLVPSEPPQPVLAHVLIQESQLGGPSEKRPAALELLGCTSRHLIPGSGSFGGSRSPRQGQNGFAGTPKWKQVAVRPSLAQQLHGYKPYVEIA